MGGEPGAGAPLGPYDDIAREPLGVEPALEHERALQARWMLAVEHEADGA
jgi:hypothetical protein